MSEWSHGLCDICHDCTCCCALVVPCVVLGENVHVMNNMGITVPVVSSFNCGKGTEPHSAGCLYAIGWFSGVLANALGPANPAVGGVGIIECGSVCLHAEIRGAIRNQYGIQPDCACCGCCSDFCCALCCYPCALTQESAHLNHEAGGLLYRYDSVFQPPYLASSMFNDSKLSPNTAQDHRLKINF